MRIVSLVGNRPQFVKAAPLCQALRAEGEEILVHSGQHYDPDLADLFFDELGIPAPDHSLAVGPGSPLHQLTIMMERLEPVLADTQPDALLVYGDTTTTLAGALVAAKMDVPLAHVEAGLRSFDKRMPEEQNRVITDHLSDVLLCPTQQAVDNLTREGVTKGVHLVGDVMYDACRAFAALAAKQPGAVGRGLKPGGYVLVTIHRAAATDTPEALSAMVEVLTSLGAPAIFPVHPRTRAKLEAAGRWDELQSVPGLIMARPAGYLDFTALLMQAQAVITDSGGVQKEAYFHGIPCITLRDTTEWVETVDGGFNRLTGMDAAKVAEAMADLSMPDERPQYYGDGHAADAIVRALVAELG
ncbi:MAG: UDP-N-acetylglucosamine 2-epimerase (non-hydrolyzing) [Actinobacteria bacterium]|nr:UDP-N-acetylglucosamine 2-epimerase (non-hydrolyzing) [Actinomycetota bacterium]